MEESRQFEPHDEMKLARSDQRHFQRHFPMSKNVLRWFLTAITFSAVLLMALNLSEEEDFLKLLNQANPIWIIAGLVLQVGTYYAEAFVWKIGLDAQGEQNNIHSLAKLSLAQLFINQAIPSAALSGALFVIKALMQKRISHLKVLETLSLSVLSYFEAYGIALIPVVLHLYYKKFFSIYVTFIAFLLIFIFCSFSYFLLRKVNLQSLRKRIRNSKISKLGPLQSLLKTVEGEEIIQLPLLVIIKAIFFSYLFFFSTF